MFHIQYPAVPTRIFTVVIRKLGFVQLSTWSNCCVQYVGHTIYREMFTKLVTMGRVGVIHHLCYNGTCPCQVFGRRQKMQFDTCKLWIISIKFPRNWVKYSENTLLAFEKHESSFLKLLATYVYQGLKISKELLLWPWGLLRSWVLHDYTYKWETNIVPVYS